MILQLSSKICATNLQTDVYNDYDAYKWSQTWLLPFNISKCVVMHYGHNNKNISYYINGIPLAESDTERDLGVLFSTNLKWKNQVITACNKANQMLGRIKKSFTHFDYKLLQSLYLTFIRPLLEFAVPVWSLFLRSDCDNISTKLLN